MNLIQFVTDLIIGRSSVGKRQPILPINRLRFSTDLTTLEERFKLHILVFVFKIIMGSNLFIML